MMISIWFSGFLKKDDLWFGLISSLLLLLLPIIVLLNPDNQDILVLYICFFGKDKSKLTSNDQLQDTLMREKVYLEEFSHILRLALRLGHVTPWEIIDLRSYQLENCKYAQLPIGIFYIWKLPIGKLFIIEVTVNINFGSSTQEIVHFGS